MRPEEGGPVKKDVTLIQAAGIRCHKKGETTAQSMEYRASYEKGKGKIRERKQSL